MENEEILRIEEKFHIEAKNARIIADNILTELYGSPREFNPLTNQDYTRNKEEAY